MSKIYISIERIDGRAVLNVGSESIEVTDYKISSSMRGGTELEVKIRLDEDITEFVTSATQGWPRQQS